MKLGRLFKKLTFSEYLAFIPMHETFSDWNSLGLYRSIIEHEKLTLEEKLEVRDLAHSIFQKQFNFLQLKDPKIYIEIASLGQELTVADERQLWEDVKRNQQRILENKKIKHRNFGDYSKHNCGVETCKYFGLMVKQGFNSGLEYESQPVKTEIVFDWLVLNLTNPSDLDGLEISSRKYEKLETSVYIGGAHNICDVNRLNIKRKKDNTYFIEGELLIIFEHEWVAENELFTFQTTFKFIKNE